VVVNGIFKELTEKLGSVLHVEVVTESCLLHLYCGTECALLYMANHSHQYCKSSVVWSTKVKGINLMRLNCRIGLHVYGDRHLSECIG
jgi:hypothetical protein